MMRCTIAAVLAFVLALSVLMRGGVIAAASPSCDGEIQHTAVKGGELCLAITTFNADPNRTYQPTLVVMLHGDLSKGGPATYHVPHMQGLSQNERIVSVAMVRPGYTDGKGGKSEGSNHRRRDSYTKPNITATGEAIANLKKRHNAKRVVLIGHSGGAAMAGVIIGMFPDLVDKAILVSCPCNIRRWRKRWKRSLSPSSFVNKVPATTEVIVVVGKKDRITSRKLSADYAASLKKRNINVKLSVVESAGHNFDRSLAQAALWEAY
ncbi:MAG: alpha/beta hydrolase [Hyphomicrobiaceae bacterium]|nr:alpha/beta hydrolase [Hyphomicrobiaceae bacterium]